MIPTFFGVIILLAGGVLLLRGDAMALLAMMMVCGLFGGSAAVILTAIGGSSIPPNQFALLFAALRVMLPGGGQIPRVREGLHAARFLLIYALYGIFGAFVFSRVFTGMMDVVPLRLTKASSYIYYTVPLAFSPQNITVSVYLTGTLMGAVVGYVAMHARDAPSRFVKTAVVLAWIHIAFGLVAAAMKGTFVDTIVDVVRNATYSQTDQTVGGFVRITGVMPEPSAYAGFGFVWFVFLFECWVRGLHARRTGPAALVLALVLLFSTSSTAYVALSIYALLLAIRFILFPQGLGFSRLTRIAAVLAACAMLVAVLAVLVPQLVDVASRIVLSMTVEKQNSMSGLQRTFWARVGLDAFRVSYGLGIGAGSFRSSSIATAVLGSVGVVGTAAILMHIWGVVKPLRASTYAGEEGIARYGFDAMVGAAAGWTMLSMLIPGMLLASSCDPGMDFGVFSGVALALRLRAPAGERRAPRPFDDPPPDRRHDTPQRSPAPC